MGKPALGAVAVVIMCLAGAAWGRGGTKGSGGSEYGDGFITPDEACVGGPEFWGQDQVSRPWGGVLLVPPSLESKKRAALSAAIRLRRERGGAVWRVVDADPPLPVGFDAMLFTSCGPELSTFAFVGDAPSGALGVRWDAKPEADWVSWLASALAFAEGDGPF